MKKTFLVIASGVLASVILSTVCVVLLLPALAPDNGPVPEPARPPLNKEKPPVPDDMVRNRIEVNKQLVWNLVLEDIENYGIDIFRLFCDISHGRNAEPGTDFGTDKSIKKLEVTYPNSHTYKLALALIYYKAIMHHDFLLIEKAIAEISPDGKSRLLPNGLELEPHLYVALYDYYIHTEKFIKAYDVLKVVEEKYADSLISVNEENLLPVKSWILQQKKIMAALEKYKKKGDL